MRKIIDIHNLDFQYNRNEKLLSDFSIQLRSGKIYGLLGKDGEGKSTLLKLISGLLFPINGKIDVLGFEPRLRQPKMLKDIFFLPEELISPSISIQTFEKIYAPFYPDFSSSTFYKYMNDFGVDTKTENIAHLTYAQKKKFFIAFALSTNVSLFLLDEPTNGLDKQTKKQFRDMISLTTNERNCILISTHQPLDLENTLDQIMIMNDHEIIFNEKRENIISKFLFKLSSKNEFDKSVIYSEETINGYRLLCENTGNEASKIDIELLFNAIMNVEVKILDILNHP